MKIETIQFIRANFGHYQSIQSKSLHKIPQEIMDDLLEEIVKIPQYQTVNNLITSIIKNLELKRCPQCGNLMFFSKSYGARKQVYCCHKCANFSDARAQKISNTWHTNLSDEQIKDKIVQKRKKTCTQKYGVDNAAKCEAIRQKIENTNIKKYGCKCSLNNIEVDKKARLTCIEKYGEKYSTQNDKINQKRRQTYIQNFGVDNPAKNATIIQKTKKTVYQREFLKLQERFKQYVVPMFTQDEYCGQNHSYLWKCVKCKNEFASTIHTSGFNKNDWGTPRCPNCYPPLTAYSNVEKQIVDFVRSIYNGEIQENTKNVISPLELDIVIPDKKIAIEFNGLYWHSTNRNGNRNYHKLKSDRCEKIGFQLLHIFEDDWRDKSDCIKSRIKSLLGIYERKIYARKCRAIRIDTNMMMDFCNRNALNSKEAYSICYGLLYDNKLVFVMAFDKVDGKVYKLSQFCSLLNVQVLGGFSKLLNKFNLEFNPEIILYEFDRQYANNNTLVKCGFVEKERTEPMLYYIHNVQDSRYIKRSVSVLVRKRGCVTKNTIFDCGNIIYSKN